MIGPHPVKLSVAPGSAPGGGWGLCVQGCLCYHMRVTNRARSPFWGSLSAQWVAKVLVALLSLGLTVLLGRRLGPEAFGVYSFLMAAGGLWVLLQDGGYTTLLFREGVRTSDGLVSGGYEHLHRHAVGNLAAVSLLGAVAAAFLLPGQGWDMRLAGVLVVVLFAGHVLGNFVSARLRADGAFKTEAVWGLGLRASTAVAAGVAVLIHPTVLVVILAWTAGVWVMLLAAPRKAVARPAFSDAPRLLRVCLPLLTIEAATAIYFRSDIVVMELLGVAPADIGQYAAAYKVLEGAGLFLAPLSQIWFRDLRKAWPDRSALRRALSVRLRIMLGLLVAGLGVGLLAGPPAIRLVFGDQYAPAADLFRVLVLSLAGIMPGAVLTQAALAMNLEKAYAASAVLAAVCNVLLNLALIPVLGPVGAAWATLATELSLAFMVWRAVRRVAADPPA